MAHKGPFALEDLLRVVGCRWKKLVRDLWGSREWWVEAAGPYSHPRMPMFSLALMWDSSSYKAENRRESGEWSCHGLWCSHGAPGLG